MNILEQYSDFIDSFYNNPEDRDKLKKSLKSIHEDKAKTSKLSTVVLIGEMKYKSLRLVSKKLKYADPTKLEYKTFTDDKNNVIKINIDDSEYKFSLNNEDTKDHIIIIRSGYKNPYIANLAKIMIEMGFKVFNNPEFVNISNDKFLSAQLLDRNNIPQPKYVLIESSDIKRGDDSKLEKKLSKIYKKIDDNTKFVCKLLNGHGGSGVFLCSKSNIMSVLQCFFAIDKDCKILVQEFLQIKDGDIRVHVITINDKQVILDSSMRKKSSSDFRTNISLGNSQIPDIELSTQQKELALKTAKASGLLWCGVDILPLEDGSNVVIEYNGAPGPPSELTTDPETLEKSNEDFFSKLLETIDLLL